MARRPRVQFAGACYHIIHRGINGEAIFKQDIEKFYVLKLLRTFTTMFNCSVLAYTLLDNHYHVMLQIHEENLSKIMHRLNGRFAQYYNWRHKRKSYVFQGRFQAYLIMDDRHMTTVLRYIHQNAVRAGIVKNMTDYPWCSDQDYREKFESGWVNTRFILNIFSKNRQAAQITYRELMGVPLMEKEIKEIYNAPGYEQEKVDGSGEADNDTHAGEWAAIGTEAKKEIAAARSPEMETNSTMQLDRILRQSCESDSEFDLIKKGSRARSLTAVKKAYIRQAREAGFNLEQIGTNISASRYGVGKLCDQE